MPDLDDLEGLGIWPEGASGAATVQAPRKLRGFVGYRHAPRLAQIHEEIGASGGLYRQTWQLQDENSGTRIGEDFFFADAVGMKTWLHCVGTPSDLSPHPELTGNSYGTGLPEYARFPPTDPVAWADRILARIAAIETANGIVPDYVEIWNEVERVEWFTGTVQEVLDLYAAAASRIKSVRPAVKVGGPALAGWRSAMDGEESVVFALIRHCAALGAPLDFVSWHHYAPGNEILLSDMPARCKALAAEQGLGTLETIVSEWNLYPSAEGAVGPEFDGPHCAANYAGFLSTAVERGLDGSMFFLDVDEDNDPGITDLAGVSLGALTLHGIKKPVFRVMEESFTMLDESPVPVFLEVEEDYNLRVFASRRGDRTRVMISNDVVTSTWIYVNKARQYGMDPNWLTERLAEAGGPNATVAELMVVGLTAEQAEAVVAFMPMVLAADQRAQNPQDVVVTVLGDEAFSVGRVLRFDATNNAPATQREAILPAITAVSTAATYAAAVATADFLAGWGYFYTPETLAAIPESQFLDWAATEGIPSGISNNALKLLRDVKRDERFAGWESLNDLPETALQVLAAADAGVAVDGRKLRFSLDPDAVLILDLMH